jgi:hypothetical protein
MRSLPVSLSAKLAAAAVAASTLFLAGTTEARPILVEPIGVGTGIRADLLYVPAETYDSFDLQLTGSYKFNRMLGVSTTVPIGFYNPDVGDNEVIFGNVDITPRFSMGMNLGVVKLGVGASLHLFVPSTTGDLAANVANTQLAIAVINHPGERAFKDFGIQPIVAANVGIAMFDVYASVGPSFLIPTDDGDTASSLQGGLGVGFTPLPLVTVQAEFFGNQPFDDKLSAQYQVGAGLVVRPPVVNLSANVRVPVDEASRNAAPVIVGFGLGASF